MDESSVIDLGKSQLDTNSNLDSKVKDNKWHMVLGIEFDVVLTSYATCGWAGQALAHPDFESSVNPIPTIPRGQIMPTTLLLTQPDLKT